MSSSQACSVCGRSDGEHDEPLLEALDLDRFRDSQARRESLAFLKALRLAGDRLDVFEALCRGERVPRSQLDPQWLKAYGS